MLPKLKVIAIAAVLLLPAARLIADPDSKSAAGSNDATYSRKIEERVAKIVATLELKNEEQSRRVHAAIVAQYRILNIWHETNDARLMELKKTTAAPDTEKGAAAKTEIEQIHATLKVIHDNYLAQLAKDLSPELVERVKDGMTVGKVQFTYTGYMQEYPSLTEEQRAKVLEFLKEAREEAMDAGNIDEKSAIFNRYKGRINNWLSKQGVDSGKGKKPKAEKKEPAA